MSLAGCSRSAGRMFRHLCSKVKRGSIVDWSYHHHHHVMYSDKREGAPRAYCGESEGGSRV